MVDFSNLTKAQQARHDELVKIARANHTLAEAAFIYADLKMQLEELEKRLAAANEVVQAAKKMDGYHSTNCEMTHMAERAKYCDCGICDLRIAMQKFESANG